jgi:hypothetical protein
MANTSAYRLRGSRIPTHNHNIVRGLLKVQHPILVNTSIVTIMEKKKDYTEIVVESFIPNSTSGRHGEIHIRPIKGQDPFVPTMNVECSKKLSEDYPVGTRFIIKGIITTRGGKGTYIYSSYRWGYTVKE